MSNEQQAPLSTEQGVSSKYAKLLNALDEMQQSPAYAVRRAVLNEAELTILHLETKLKDAERREMNARCMQCGCPNFVVERK